MGTKVITPRIPDFIHKKLSNTAEIIGVTITQLSGEIIESVVAGMSLVKAHRNISVKTVQKFKMAGVFVFYAEEGVYFLCIDEKQETLVNRLNK